MFRSCHVVQVSVLFFFFFLSNHYHFFLKIDAKRDQLSDAKRELKSAKADAKVRRDEKSKK